MYTRTKIICTIGPAVNSYEKILELIDAGMNVARLNFSHGSYDQHKKTIQNLKKARKEKNVPLAILLDTKGPEIRVGKLPNDTLELNRGDKVKLVSSEGKVKSGEIPINPPSVLENIDVGMKVLFDDGYISTVVVEKNKGSAIIEIQNNGILLSNKGVNIPHGSIELPDLTEKDKEDLTFGCKMDVDIVAASFIRSAENVLAVRDFLKSHWKEEIMIISKIESVMGVENFESILQVSDGIMVARGDLGVELPLNRVPKLQKTMIKKCYEHGKPVVTATQMLESMIHNPRPTRAEVSDVANAIYDSTSCVMLSGETAIGKYPIEATKMMKNIALETEKDFNYKAYFQSLDFDQNDDLSSSVALATVKIAYSTDAKAIFAYTSSGFTSRLISRLRPKIPIISLTDSQKTYNQIAFLWGVIPYLDAFSNIEEAFDLSSCFLLKNKLAVYGDLVLVTAGTPFGIKGTTNMMQIKSIGDVVVRGLKAKGETVFGKACHIGSQDEIKSSQVKGKIVILTHCEKEYAESLKGCLGIILQSHRSDRRSEISTKAVAKNLEVPALVRAENASVLIEEGEKITLSVTKGAVFRGKIGSDKEMLKRVCHANSQSCKER